MAANGKPRHYEQAGAAMVTPEVNEIIQAIAAREDRPVARVIRQLIEEHPRIKAALKPGPKVNGTARTNSKRGK